MIFDKLINILKRGSIIYNSYDKIDTALYNRLLRERELEKEKDDNYINPTAYKLIKYRNQSQFDKDVTIFDEIIGHENIKKILKNMIDSVFVKKKPVSILLDGSPGCGKSMFLKAIEQNFPSPQTYFIDGSRATKAGIFDVLFEDENNRIKILLIDEIDKLNLDDQEALLTLMQDGRLVQTQKNGKRSKTYDNLSVIAASNDKDKMLVPLLTRFFDIHIKDYTDYEIKYIGRERLKKYQLLPEVIDYIMNQVIKTDKESKIRYAEQIAKLCNNDIKMVDLLLENSQKK